MSVVIFNEETQFEETLRRVGVFSARTALEQFEYRTPELMTKAQLAEYLQCSQSNINHLMNKKGLPFERCGDVPRFRKSDVDLWLKLK